MIDVLERLAAVKPVRTDDLGPSSEDGWRSLNDDPLRHPARRRVPARLRPRGLRRLAAVGVGVATAGVAVLVLGTTGGGPASALAGWTATPTKPASGETSGALDQCRSQLAQARTGPSGIPAGGWQPVVTDTRGPFTAMVLRSGSASATCVSGPSFTSTSANDTQSTAGSQHSASGSTSGGGTADGSAPPSVSIFDPRSGPINHASEADLTTSSGKQYTLVQGQLAAGVTGVTLLLSDGSNVQATVEDRSLIAWWPGSATVSSARVQTGAGVSTQKLGFTPLPGSPGSPADSSHTAHGSSSGPAPSP